MPAVTVSDVTTLPRVPEPGPTDLDRGVRQVTTAPSGYEGEGFPVRRAFAGVDMKDLDPFLHMDQMGEVEYAPGEPTGTRTAASRPSPTSSTARSSTVTRTVAAARSRTATRSG